ncbi:folate family ECF transporter S component [Peptacetobacter sp.]|uniref:folate family ECF transporter S component n=1 Tax=Peptacetobacter sp. TaxID=2991975 RepID=UPI002605D891|nr:folate family ECF transporter S component [Peptacetobacter sp.]
MNKITTKDMVIMSLLIAITIVLSRFLSISTPIIKIGFSFVPITIAGILYGAKYTMLISIIADLIGATLITGDFFPGFTVTTALVGIVYGKFLYNKSKSVKNIVLCVVIANLIELILNTGNIYLLSGYGFLATLPVRSFKALLMIPIKALVIYNVSYPIASMKNMVSKKRVV